MSISYRGTIVRWRDLKQTKNGKFYFTVVTVYNPKGGYTDGEFIDITFYGPNARSVADKFADNTYQKGDIICIDSATETVGAYMSKGDPAKGIPAGPRASRSLSPIGNKRDRKDEDGNLMFDEKGRQLYDYTGGYEIIFGKNHVYQADCVPEPSEERQAVPPEKKPVEVDDEGLPWD